jgi:uncharacterized phiE125 gp8 family phage protein
MITFPPKEAGETEKYAFDFTDALAGDTILTKDVLGTGVAVNGSSIDGNLIRMVLSGGTDGTTAKVTATITTSGGETFSEVATLQIGREVISLAEAKAYLRVRSSDEDAKIRAMIPRARKWVEDHTGLALIRREFTERHLPKYGAIQLFRGPLVTVDSVAYTDADGDQTYTPRSFVPDTTIFPAANGRWPSLFDGNQFEITYTAGFDEGEIDERLIGAVCALIEGEFSEGYAYPERAIDAAERCCGYLRTQVL